MTTQNLSQRKNKATHREPKFMITNHRSMTTNTRSIIINTKSMTTNTRPMITNHANQQIVANNMYLTKKQMQTINRTTKNWLKVESKETVHDEFPPYESTIINHRNQQLLASP